MMIIRRGGGGTNKDTITISVRRERERAGGMLYIPHNLHNI